MACTSEIKGALAGGRLRFHLGPYTTTDINQFKTLNFLSGKCTLRTFSGRPLNAEKGVSEGISILKFVDIDASGGGLKRFKRGDTLIMDNLPWIIHDIYSDNTLAVRDLENYWIEKSQEGPLETSYFLEVQSERAEMTTGEGTSVAAQLDGFTYKYQVTDEGKSPLTELDKIPSLFNLIIPTITTGVFYIYIEAYAPSSFQTNLQPEEVANAIKIYSNITRTITFEAPVTPVQSSGSSSSSGYGSGSSSSSSSSSSSGSSTSVVESSSTGCVGLGCEDPFSIKGGADIEPVCDDENLYNPYAQNKSSNLYKQLNNIVSDIFGHKVNYFRTTADARTKDVHLFEYSLFNVVANFDVKILVPDNEFPEEANTFDIFGMEFAEFEVHIVHEKFKTIFGEGLRPRARDYMFIPIINKMYEVNSVSIADEFNAEKSYWRLKLTKYQDRSSVIKGSFADVTDGLVTGISEVFGEEIADEETKVTNPVQFQSISKVLEDGSRVYMDSGLKIVDEAIVNNFQTVSHNHYDLSKVTIGAPAIKYKAPSNMIIDGQIAVTAWFRPTFEITDTTDYFILSDQIASGGFDIKISTLRISVNIDGVETTFTHNTSLSKTKWYGIGVNIRNNTERIDVVLFSISTTGHVSSMASEFSQSKTMTNGQLTWSNAMPYVLKGSKLNLTCLRIFDKAIETTEWKNILNQYVVRDNQHALVIDNAIPSLGYQKFKNAR